MTFQEIKLTAHLPKAQPCDSCKKEPTVTPTASATLVNHWCRLKGNLNINKANYRDAVATWNMLYGEVA